jgi:tetratricopeptide (TPR) repeat protein
MDCYKKAIKINPNYADAYCNFGVTFMLLGKLEKAKECFEKALGKDKTNKKYLSAYGKLLLKMNDHPKGIKFLQKSDGVIKFSQSDFKIIKQ